MLSHLFLFLFVFYILIIAFQSVEISRCRTANARVNWLELAGIGLKYPLAGFKKNA